MTAHPSPKKDTHQMIFILVSAGILAVTSLCLNAVTWVKLQNSIGEQHQAMERLADWQLLKATVLETEVAARGHVISGAENFREQHNEEKETFGRSKIELLQDIEREGGDDEEWQRFSAAADAVFESAREAMVVREHSGSEAATAFFSQGSSLDALQRLRTGSKQAIEKQELEIAERSATMNADLLAGAATSTATGVLALGMGLIAFLLYRRVERETKRSERFSASVLKAQKARRQKDSFVAMMSHEIRTPLNAIIGFSQLLEQEAQGELTKRYAASIIEGGHALLRLINDVLDLSKLEAGMMRLSLEPTDLRELATFCERIFRGECVAKDVLFETKLDPQLPHSLLMDTVRLRQIMLNLIGNAVKFTESGSVRLEISGSPSASEAGKWDIAIVVSDTGPGIPEEDREKIFEPFVQGEGASESGVEPASGTGLGLSIVTRFLALMGGSIRVDSCVGEGSTMRVSLPGVLTSPIFANQSPADEEADFNSFAPTVIVAADDNPTNRQLLSEIFRRTHHTLHCAATGDEALRMVEQISPDLVLLDIRMPGLDGIEVAELIRKDPKRNRLPIIAVTAGSLGDEGPDENAPFDDRVRKPYTQTELYAALARFLPVAKRAETAAATVAPAKIPAAAHPELIRLNASVWPGVKNRMKISEVREFADQIQNLGDNHNCDTMSKYATDLAEAADSFSVQKLTNLLESFPGWLKIHGVEGVGSNPLL